MKITSTLAVLLVLAFAVPSHTTQASATLKESQPNVRCCGGDPGKPIPNPYPTPSSPSPVPVPVN